MTQPFIIYALPRSRTTWLSKFLTYAGWECLHDPSVVYSKHELIEYLRQPRHGIVDTGLVNQWREVQKWVPEAKLVCIDRDADEVRNSLAKIGFDFPLTSLCHSLDELCYEPGLMYIPYEALTQEKICRSLFKYLTGEDCGHDWWAMLDKANIQVDVSLGPPGREHAKF